MLSWQPGNLLSDKMVIKLGLQGCGHDEALNKIFGGKQGIRDEKLLVIQQAGMLCKASQKRGKENLHSITTRASIDFTAKKYRPK